MTPMLKHRPRLAPVLWSGLFCLMALLLWFGSGTIRSRSDGESVALLSDSLRRAAVHCYAVEGRYPPDLEYLCDAYGVRYDADRFVVYYLPTAANLMPDITVLELGEGVVG